MMDFEVCGKISKAWLDDQPGLLDWLTNFWESVWSQTYWFDIIFANNSTEFCDLVFAVLGSSTLPMNNHTVNVLNKIGLVDLIFFFPSPCK